MGVTATYGLPYPALGDSPDGASQIQSLAEAADTALATVDTTLAAAIAAIQQPDFAYRTANQSWGVGMTLTTDPELTLTLDDPAGVYHVTGLIRYDAGSATLYQHKFLFPASSTWAYACTHKQSGGALDDIAVLNGTIVDSWGNGAGYAIPMGIDGLLIMGGSTGVLTFQAANQTTGGAGWTHYAGCYLRAEKITGT